MSTKAVLIVGGSGFVGTHLALRLRDQFRVFATYHKHAIRVPGITCLPMDLGNRNWIKRAAYAARPDYVIYLAGRGIGPWRDDEVKLAEFLHTGGVATVSQAVDILQPKFIYLSTCFVFDGSRGNYKETDTILPDSVLGNTKLAGENIVRSKLNYMVIRSSPLFGRGNGYHLSFLDRLRMALARGQRVEFSENEVHSFAPVQGLVELVERTISSGVKNKTLHYGGLTKVSYYEFARAFAEHQGYDPKLVARAAPASTSTDHSLNSSLAVETFKIKPLTLEEGLDLLGQQEAPSEPDPSGLFIKAA